MVEPVSVPIVELIVSLGAVVSTVAVTAAVVVMLPALSVALAVRLWLPSVSARVVKFQLPATIVAAPRSVAPSNTCTDDTPLVSLTVPDSASVLSWVSPPLAIVVVRAGIGADRCADRLARRRGVERYRQRRRGRGVARRIGELRRNRLAAVRPEVARRHRQAHAARRDVGRRDGVRHRMGEGRAAQQQLDRVADRNRPD